MPILITRKSKEELEQEFRRAGADVENLGDYVDALRDLDLGEGFSMQVVQIERDVTENGKTERKTFDVIPDAADKEGNAPTMRAFKLRTHAAAKSLGRDIKWKIRGHRVDGGKYVIDQITAQIRAAKVEKNGTAQAA